MNRAQTRAPLDGGGTAVHVGQYPTQARCLDFTTETFSRMISVIGARRYAP
jgi:hypothetical protein